MTPSWWWSSELVRFDSWSAVTCKWFSTQGIVQLTQTIYEPRKPENTEQGSTRASRMLVFWGYPSPPPPPPQPPPPTPHPPWLPILLIHIGPQYKTRQSQNYKFNEFGKTSNLKMLDKMCKYEMDLASIVEDTERTRFCRQTNRRTDGQGETSIPPFNFIERRV